MRGAAGRYLTSTVIGVLACLLIVSLVGLSASTLLSTLWQGSVGSSTDMLNVLRWSTPEIVVGLSFAIGHRAGLFNLGIDGQFYAGALAATLVGIYLPLPVLLAPLLALAAAVTAGACWAGIASWLLNRFGVTEVVSTLMLNYIAALLTTWLIKTFFLQQIQGQSSYTIATGPIRTEAELPLFNPASQANIGFVVAILLALGTFVLIYRTGIGYRLRALGASPAFARYAGIDAAGTRLRAFLLSGGVAGLAGGLEVLGVQHSFVAGFSNNLGFDGIIVSIIGAHNPLGIMLSGIFYGAIKNAGLTLALGGDVSSYVVTLLTAVFIFAFSVRPRLPRRLLRRAVRAS